MTQLAPIPNDFTSVVATRELDLVQDGSSSKLIVEIGLPVQDVETVSGMDWRCPVRFVNGASIRVRRACGIDSFQAVRLAFRLIQSEIEQLEKDQNAQVLFLGEPCRGAD